MEALTIEIKYRAYSKRLFSSPWIAKIVAWPIGGNFELEWGGYVGDAEGGVCEIEAEPGDIIRTGQKNKQGGQSDNGWFVVNPAGKLRKITPTRARKLFQQPLPINKLLAFSDSEIIEEAQRRGLM